MCPTCEGTGSVNDIDLDAQLDRRTATSSLPCRSRPGESARRPRLPAPRPPRELSGPGSPRSRQPADSRAAAAGDAVTAPDTSLLVCSPSRAGRRSRPPGPARRPPPRTRCPAAPPSDTPCAGARTRTRYRCGHCLARRFARRTGGLPAAGRNNARRLPARQGCAITNWKRAGYRACSSLRPRGTVPDSSIGRRSSIIRVGNTEASTSNTKYTPGVWPLASRTSAATAVAPSRVVPVRPPCGQRRLHAGRGQASQLRQGRRDPGRVSLGVLSTPVIQGEHRERCFDGSGPPTLDRSLQSSRPLAFCAQEVPGRANWCDSSGNVGRVARSPG